MAEVDHKLAIKLQRKKEREDAIMSRAEQEKVWKITSTATSEVAVEALDSESVGQQECRVAAALDRTQISNRNPVYALASFSIAVVKTPTDLALNC